MGFTESRMDGFVSWSFSEQLKSSPLKTSGFFWACVLWLVCQVFNRASAPRFVPVKVFVLSLCHGINWCGKLKLKF